MRVGAVAMLLVAMLAAAASGATSSYTAGATTACLNSRHVLVSRKPIRQVLPRPLPATAALQISFALIPAQAIDNGYIVFEPTAGKAKTVAAAWYAYSIEQASHVKGVDLSMIKIRLRDVFTVSGNAITVWNSQPVKPASRRLVASCLR
jgi:hypothetical protein